MHLEVPLLPCNHALTRLMRVVLPQASNMDKSIEQESTHMGAPQHVLVCHVVESNTTQ